MRSTLDRILDGVRTGLPSLAARRGELEAAAAARPAPPDFRRALVGPRVAVIAELKRRSPSAGLIAPKLVPAERARVYEGAGAAALSVLTEAAHFGGALADLESVRSAVALPLLRKDFILHELQVVEARAAGASAVLLIVRALTPAMLRDLLAAAGRWGIGALVEAHDRRELDVALAAGATIIGVNSRDLGNFTIDTGAAWGLVKHLPSDVVAVAESGMQDAVAVRSAAEAGADAVLVGSALSVAPDPAALLAELAAVPRHGR
ncbi:MAG TPA: indole-3-glycerol-phosphate synthase [Gemmatimonadales bacterium]|nr:indole-3-glycerol-phosphate synthase [Gemmatimonadales bacterium]